MSDRRFHPTLECLESRLTPAVCLVQFFSNSLFISGSLAADNVTISQPSAGRIVLTGNGTTFNFNNHVVSFVSVGSAANPVKNMTAFLAGGGDSLQFSPTGPITLAGNCSIDLGNGNGTLSELGGNPISVGGNLTIHTGTGNQNIALAGFNVTGSTSITIGRGANESIAISNDILHALTIVTDFGTKVISMDDVNVLGATIINGGYNSVGSINTQLFINALRSFGTTVDLKGGLVYSDSSLNSGSDTIGLYDGTTVGSALRVTTFGPANEYVALLGVTIMGSTTLNIEGSGNQWIILSANNDDALFNGPVKITTGAGDDSIAVGTGGINTTFNSTVDVALNAGNDEVTVGSATTNILFNAPAVFDGGPGTDQFELVGSSVANSPFIPAFINFFP